MNDSTDPTFYLLRELAETKALLRKEQRRSSKARARALRWKNEAQDWKWQALTVARRQRTRVEGNDAQLKEAA